MRNSKRRRLSGARAAAGRAPGSAGSLFAQVSKFVNDVRGYFRILGVLFLREFEIKKRDPLISVLEVLEPIIFLGTVLSIRIVAERGIGIGAPFGTSLILFLISGFYPKYLWIFCAGYMPVGNPRRRFPTEQRLDYIFIHLTWTTLDHIVLGIVVFTGIYFFITPQALPFDFAPIVESLLAMVALGFGWGMINRSIAQRFQFWRFIGAGINRAMIIVSGAFFVPDFMSPTLRYWISFNPMLHAVALFRTGIYPQYPTLVLDTTYLTTCVIVAIAIGLVLERVTRRGEIG
jgi:capsular polysaccharide transport system permease protein